MIKKGKLRKVNKQEKGNRISNNYSFMKNQNISQRKAIHKQKVSESGDFAIKETIGVDIYIERLGLVAAKPCNLMYNHTHFE